MKPWATLWIPGPERRAGRSFSASEMDEWYFKRNALNRYFASLGYTHINVNRKPWCEGPYDREMQSVQMHKPNHRNWLTTVEGF